jgi:hypothetical protein
VLIIATSNVVLQEKHSAALFQEAVSETELTNEKYFPLTPRFTASTTQASG